MSKRRKFPHRPLGLLLLAALPIVACGPADGQPDAAGDTADAPIDAGGDAAAGSAYVAAAGPVAVVFSIAEPDLLPENVAYDPVTGAYYVGSTRKGKILRVVGGEVSEFRPARADSLWMVVGMKVDPERRVLWVCSSQGRNLMGDTIRDGGAAALLRFDLDTGTTLDRWVVDSPGSSHFLNDVVIASDGTAFVTHMFDEPGVWAVPPDGDLELFVALPEQSFPNGIALSPDQTVLYVATARGIARIDRGDRSITTLAAAEPNRTAGLDGLYAIDGALIGVQPDPGAVIRFDLEPGGSGISAITTLIAGHPTFRVPTTGVIVGDELHFIANSQFNRITADGSLPPLSELADPVVLSIPLDPAAR